MDEEIIRLASNELLKGAKMLSTHCPKCGSPLFEKDGKIYCPVCEKLKNEKTSKNENTKIEKLKEGDKSNNTKVEDILNEKISYLLDKLKDEKEISRIKEIGETLYLLIKIKKKMQ